MGCAGGKEKEVSAEFFLHHPNAGAIESALTELAANTQNQKLSAELELTLEAAGVESVHCRDPVILICPCALAHEGALWPGYLWLTQTSLLMKTTIFGNPDTIHVPLKSIEAVNRCVLGLSELGVSIKLISAFKRAPTATILGDASEGRTSLQLFDFESHFKRDLVHALLSALSKMFQPMAPEQFFPDLSQVDSDADQIIQLASRPAADSAPRSTAALEASRSAGFSMGLQNMSMSPDYGNVTPRAPARACNSCVLPVAASNFFLELLADGSVFQKRWARSRTAHRCISPWGASGQNQLSRIVEERLCVGWGHEKTDAICNDVEHVQTFQWVSAKKFEYRSSWRPCSAHAENAAKINGHPVRSLVSVELTITGEASGAGTKLRAFAEVNHNRIVKSLCQRSSGVDAKRMQKFTKLQDQAIQSSQQLVSEWVKIAQSCLEAQQAVSDAGIPSHRAMEFIDAFDLLDLDNSGDIDASEVEKVLERLQISQSEQLAQRLRSIQQVNFQEFLQLLLEDQGAGAEQMDGSNPNCCVQ